MVLLQKAISSVFNLILTSNVRLEDDVREVKKSISTELSFNAVFKRIAYLEMEKLLPSFTQMQQEKKNFSLFLYSSFGTGTNYPLLKRRNQKTEVFPIFKAPGCHCNFQIKTSHSLLQYQIPIDHP